jgi:hypothetical protein
MLCVNCNFHSEFAQDFGTTDWFCRLLIQNHIESCFESHSARFTSKTTRHGELKVSRYQTIFETLLIPARYEYVKAFEQPDFLLPNTWIVVRIDGRGFHK